MYTLTLGKKQYTISGISFAGLALVLGGVLLCAFYMSFVGWYTLSPWAAVVVAVATIRLTVNSTTVCLLQDQLLFDWLSRSLVVVGVALFFVL